MSSAKKVVVLGGGVGGVATAIELRKKLPSEHSVVLVNRITDHLFSPSLLWLMIGDRTEAKITGSLQHLEKKGIELVIGEIEQIDPNGRTVTVDGSTVEGDYMVISLGADLDESVVPGLSSAGHGFYSLAGAKSLRGEIERLRSGRLVVMTSEPVYKCPAAPYEGVLLLEDYLRRQGVRDNVQIDMYAAEPGPMGVAGAEVSAGVRSMVEEKGIAYHPEHKVEAVDPEKRDIRFANGEEAGFDLLAYVSPHRAPRVVSEAGLTTESGWVPVDRHTLETGNPGVYAIGDVVTIPLSLGKPLPKAGVFAHGEAKVVALNIAADILGNDGRDNYNGHGSCFVETGNGKAAFGKGDFFAEPKPKVKLHRPGRHWHWGKVLLEKKLLRPLK